MNTNQTNQQAPMWAYVELMGHQKIAGQLIEETRFGFTFMRVDVPETETQPAFTQFYNPSSVYRINLCTEEVARRFAESINAKPVTIYDINEAVKKAVARLPEPAFSEGEYGAHLDYEDDDDNEFDDDHD